MQKLLQINWLKNSHNLIIFILICSFYDNSFSQETIKAEKKYSIGLTTNFNHVLSYTSGEIDSDLPRLNFIIPGIIFSRKTTNFNYEISVNHHIENYENFTTGVGKYYYYTTLKVNNIGLKTGMQFNISNRQDNYFLCSFNLIFDFLYKAELWVMNSHKVKNNFEFDKAYLDFGFGYSLKINNLYNLNTNMSFCTPPFNRQEILGEHFTFTQFSVGLAILRKI